MWGIQRETKRERPRDVSVFKNIIEQIRIFLCIFCKTVVFDLQNNKSGKMAVRERGRERERYVFVSV